MSAKTATDLGLKVGTWNIDPTHSQVGFSVRHMMVSKVRGFFTDFAGQVVIAEELTASTVNATIKATSIDTRDSNRDNHVRSADFLEVETYPEITFSSTAIEPSGSDFKLTGDLTIHGVTKPVTFNLEFDSTGPDAYGGIRAGLTATGTISRKQFGLEWNAAMETGGLIVGDEVKFAIDVELVLA